MENFLPYLEIEIGILRRECREFAKRYPIIAGELMLIGERSADPQIERLIQSTAALNARVMRRIDDEFCEFTESLLNLLYPHYLRPMPSYSVARIDASNAQANAVGSVTTLARGTQLKSVVGGKQSCKFKTVYDVAVAPLALTRVHFEPLIRAPADTRLPDGATARIAIDIDSNSPVRGLEQVKLKLLRIFIDGDPSLRAALRDTLFMRVARAYVELDGDGRWMALDKVPLASVGFDDDEALLPCKATENGAYRLLSEYFSYPEKFNFFDLDLAALLKRGGRPCHRLTLHLALSDMRPDGNTARMLKPLSAQHLLLACTPVVNLFRQSATPIRVTHMLSEYPLLANASASASCDIYSIDSMHLQRTTGASASLTEFVPYYSLRHGEGKDRKGHYWRLRRDENRAVITPGHEFSLAFTDRDFVPTNMETATMSIELTCTNRDLPGMLQYGSPAGDLSIEGGPSGHPIRLLRKPSESRRLGAKQGAHWGLLAHLSLNHRSLTSDGREAFVAMLRLYALPDDTVAMSQIDGIVDLGHKPATAWLRGRHRSAYLNGVEVYVTLDEDAFIGSGMHAFAQVLDHFFGLYVHMNSYTQLIVLSKRTGKELMRCPPRNGTLSLA